MKDVPIVIELKLRPAHIFEGKKFLMPIFANYDASSSIQDIVPTASNVLPVSVQGALITHDGKSIYYLSRGGDADLGDQALISIDVTRHYDPREKKVKFVGRMWVMEWDGERGDRPKPLWGPSCGSDTDYASDSLQRFFDIDEEIVDVKFKEAGVFESTFLVTRDLSASKADKTCRDGKFDIPVKGSIVTNLSGQADVGTGENLGRDCLANLMLSTIATVTYREKPDSAKVNETKVKESRE
jgi:hypothetical protein